MKLSAATGCVLIAFASPCFSADLDEAELRRLSELDYSRVVLTARELGHRYKAEDIASGLERHFREAKAAREQVYGATFPPR